MKTWKKGLSQFSHKKSIFQQVWVANTKKGRHQANFELWRAANKEEGTDEELLHRYKKYLRSLDLITE